MICFIWIDYVFHTSNHLMLFVWSEKINTNSSTVFFFLVFFPIIFLHSYQHTQKHKLNIRFSIAFPRASAQFCFNVCRVQLILLDHIVVFVFTIAPNDDDNYWHFRSLVSINCSQMFYVLMSAAMWLVEFHFHDHAGWFERKFQPLKVVLSRYRTQDQ
jgi:hypothetical protein